MMVAVPTGERLPVAHGVSLHALVWRGEGAPFLLVHGLASNCRTWEGVGHRLHERGHAVAALDLRGHGRSDKPDDGYDFGTLIADLLAAIDALGFDRPIVAGQSTGGNLAVELAYRSPESVRGVTGVDGGVIELQEQWPDWEACRAALAPPPLTGRAAADLEADLRRRHPDWSEEGVVATMANLEVLPDGTARPWLTTDRHMQILRALWEQRPSRLVPDLAVPLLLVLADAGAGSTEGKRAAAERAAKTAPRARVEWFSPGDHDLHVQHPDAVADLFLAALGDGFFAS